MRMDFVRKLPIPAECKEMYPLDASLARIVEERAAELQRIFTGESDKFLVVIGPCSADREDAVMDYLTRLRAVADDVADKVFIVPRIYTNKPRTTGAGYKGMLHQPDPQGKPDLFKGIVAIRQLHMRALAECGFSAADEMLYPQNYKYLDDILAYNAVGARSVENQEHRLVASAIDGPVGMKNPTSGNFTIMLNAISAAQQSHSFIYRGWEGTSQGNPLAHAILRGYQDKHGDMHPNYHFEDMMLLARLYSESGLQNPAVMVDANHCNSRKDPLQQPFIVREVLLNRERDSALRALVKGVMVESYLEDGNQKVDGDVYGKSITDACLGWEKSKRLLYDIAEQL
ncbi:MAG TPA: 3-deoxy-7-phosphoheptulonate synthase [Eggerthellaceae bacterium]|nr:3-deoxy-7-phosphoheptulonate synthase [Eggerthellaceae bacterium]